ncbi:chondramide synthase cmdD-like, partial [Tropilaelaps mercedesae]
AKWLPQIFWRYNHYACKKKVHFPTDKMSIEELFDGFIKAFNITIEHATRQYLEATHGSSLWSGDIVTYLQSISDETMETLYGDMSKLLASVDDVVICEVPRALENLSRIIESEISKQTFINASDDKALALLKDEVGHPLSSKAFYKFLENHGHRGYNEFDVYRKPWALDSTPVITILKTLVRNGSEESKIKQTKSVWKSLNGLTCKLNLWQKAYHRKKLFPKLVELQFPECCRGTPKLTDDEFPILEGNSKKMKGFPISAGRTQAKARVIRNLDEAQTIQRGEVLITYAIDISWSSYFPLLGGVATELGGLMSHGAMVAREYDLPCVVGLIGATKVFHTGDLVLLDGADGILTRIEEAKAQNNAWLRSATPIPMASTVDEVH